MKTIKKYFTTIIFVILVSILGVKYYRGLQKSGQDFPPTERINLITGEKFLFPSEQGTSMAIYWATWCGPCKVEMYRLKQSVEKNQKLAKKIFAINLSEDSMVIKNYLEKNPHPFQFVSSGENDSRLGITATPTQILIKDRKIESYSEGLSLFGIWKAENFLED
jgi:thiol-disulfide isomerase/thioredoxin